VITLAHTNLKIAKQNVNTQTHQIQPTFPLDTYHEVLQHCCSSPRGRSHLLLSLPALKKNSPARTRKLTETLVTVYISYTEESLRDLEGACSLSLVSSLEIDLTYSNKAGGTDLQGALAATPYWQIPRL
jgi:hypothetical protein